MRGFLRHLLTFSALPGLVLLLSYAVLYGSGEVWPLDRVFAYQRTNPDALYLRAVNQAFYAYKYRGLVETRASVLVAGSSRTMKFRAEMFGDRATSFYNAGGMVNSVRDLHDFCVVLPTSQTPAVLLLGLDLWWFNDQVSPTFDFRSEITKREASVEERILAVRWLLTHPASFAGEMASLVRGRHDSAIGISARERGGGFRADGSFKSPWPVPRSDEEWRFVDRETPPIIERVQHAFGNFPPAVAVSPARLAMLEVALARLEARRVFVIGYLPPFSSEVLAVLGTDTRHARLWADFRRRLPDVFRKHGFPIIDASELSSFGMDDRAMSDGMHAEETFHVRLLKTLMPDSRVRTFLPGAERVLDRALGSPKTNFWHADLGS